MSNGTELWKFNAYKSVAPDYDAAKEILGKKKLVYGEPAMVPYYDLDGSTQVTRCLIGVGGLDGSDTYILDVGRYSTDPTSSLGALKNYVDTLYTNIAVYDASTSTLKFNF